MHGKGILYLTNGEIFKGEFQDGLPNGEGEYTTVFKTKVTGKWE
jgi:hypothetical protein